jgi:cyclase
MSWSDGRPYLDELSPGLFAYVQPHGGWMVNNCGIIADRDGATVLVDTASTEKRNRAFLTEVGRVTNGAPRVMVNTHHHPDHTYGNGFLSPETLVVGQDRCREEMLRAGLEATKVITAPDYGDLVLRPPDLTFNDRMTLHVQTFSVELRHVGPAHTTNDVLVWLPEQRALFAGDLAFNGGQPFLLEGSVAGFREALAHMRALEPELLVPGHGRVCRAEEVERLLDDMDAYVAYVAEVAATERAAGLTPLEAAEKHRDNPFREWMETERFVGNLHRAYAELSDAAERVRLTVPQVWPDMVAFHGGPIPCYA